MVWLNHRESDTVAQGNPEEARLFSAEDVRLMVAAGENLKRLIKHHL
jgi:hypothetical protein